ncbi:Myosin heavy chain-related protein [Heracleum sosnowskyi]|uniref:Myosin heavy chain-related protein n=1 Tax=Heracleum sosnowskyi TaxID=360622 RepID=A0AAD8N152_9APIA|nr:Myosin heavy chain-related protein [Heracleum sosnowskyi]
MFKSSRWKSDKHKIKAVFELQFQATQVPNFKGKKKVMISIVPESVGKPTIKLPKTSIVEGTCLWETPVYETIKLIKDSSTGIYKENVYHFIVSTGSSKSSYLGEASLDFAEFAEATQPLLVSLPLSFTDSGACLNIGVRKMQENDEKSSRDGGQNEDPKSLKSQLVDPFEDSGLDFLEDDDLKTSPETERSISFSDRRSDKTENAENSMPVRWNSLPPKRTENEVPKDKQVHQPFNTDWKQIAKEGKKGQDLSIQVVGLKEENAALKRQCELLKSSKGEVETKDVWDQPEDMMQRLRREKDLNKKMRSQLYETEDSNSELILVVNDLNKKLEQKSTEIIHLSNRIKAMQNVKEDASETSTSDTDLDTNEQARRQTNTGENKAKEELLKRITDLCEEIEVYKKDKEEQNLHMEALVFDYDTIKQEKQDISTKLEQSQILQTKIQSEYSESLAIIEDFKVQMDILEKKINKQEYEFSKSLDTIEELEFMVKNLEEQLEKQAREFEDDLEAVTQAKVKQEQRAIRAEETLRKTRCSNASSTERLQEEFEKLSLDLTSKLDENERIYKRTAAEADDLRLQKSVLEQMLQKAEGDLGLLKDQYEGKVHELSNEINLQTKQIEKMSRQLEAKNNELASIQKHDASQEMLSKQREKLEKELALSTKAVDLLKEEVTTLKTLKDEKGILVGSLQSEMENQNIQYNELKHCMLQIDLEKESLRKQVSELEGHLKKKDEVISSLDKKIKSNTEHVATRGRTSKGAISDKVKSHEENRHAVQTRPPAARQSETVKSGTKKLSDKKSNRDDCSIQTLSSEVALLNERNKHMEEELREMQDKYSEISLKFAEVEGERQQLVMSLRNLKNGKKT